MKRGGLALCGVVAMLALFSSPALAAATLDQSNGPGTSYVGGATFTQIFTAGLTGQLTAVDLYLAINGSESDTVTIQGTHLQFGDIWPDGTVLATASANVTGVDISTPSWVEFTFSTPASVTAGTQYAIVVATTNAQIYGTSGNAYAGGAAWEYDSGSSQWLGFGATLGDFSFRTFVDAAAATASPSAAASAGTSAGPRGVATPPPTSSAAAGGSDGGAPILPIAIAFLVATAAFVTRRRLSLAGR